MKRLGLAALVAFAGCSGTTPPVNGSPEQGISAVVLGGKITLASGETGSGKIWVDFESEEAKDSRAEPQTYALVARPQQTLLYRIEPGVYHYAPERSIFGGSEPYIRVKTEGGTFRVPFPREILRHPSITVRPTKIVSLGMLEARFSAALPGRKGELRVRLDDRVETRRKIVQDLIHDMMDPNAPPAVRDSAVDWTRGLDQSLEALTEESNRAAPYRPGP